MSEVDWRSSGSVARSSSVASSSGSRKEPSSSDAPSQRRGLVPQNDSFLSLSDLSPNPPSRRTSFVQQQKEAIERMSAMENAYGAHAAKAPGSRSFSRGTRLGSQVGKLHANAGPTMNSVESGVAAASPGTARTGASDMSGARRTRLQAPEAATRTTDEAARSSNALRSTAFITGHEDGKVPTQTADAVHARRGRDSIMMESSESSSSSSAAGPSSSASTDASASMTAYSAASAVPTTQTSASTLAAMQAASGASQSPTTPIDVAAARKKYRISGLQYIRNDASAGSHSRRVGSRDSAQRSPRIDRDTFDSAPASARTVRKMSSAQLLALRQEELLAEVAAATANSTYSTAPAPAEADRSGSTDGGTSAANMWQRKRASVADMLAGLETSVQSEGQNFASREPTRRKEWGAAMDNESKSSLGMEAALAEGSEKPRMAKRELFLPQLNGLAHIGDDIIGRGLSPARAEQSPHSARPDTRERLRNGSESTAGYTSSGDALVSSGEDAQMSRRKGSTQGSAERASLASTVVPTPAADATPRPSRDGSAHFPDADERTPHVAQTATLGDPARDQEAEGSAQTLPLQVIRTRQRQLSDATIAELGALPGVEPAALLNENGQPLSSKKILTIALQKAQSAVLLDSSNNVPEAMLAYRQAVRLLQEVMERVAPRTTSRSRRSNREEERRRLKVIHDTYAERIRLLSMLSPPETGHDEDLAGTDAQAEHHSTSAATGLGIRDGTSATRDDYLYPDKGAAAQTYPTIAVSSADTTEPAASNGQGHTSRRDVFSEQQQNAASGQYRQNARTYLDDFTSSATHTPATPYFDIDPQLGDEDTTEELGDPAGKSSQQTSHSRTAFALAQSDAESRRKLVRRRSSSPKAERSSTATMVPSASLQGRAPESSSAGTSNGSATLGVQRRPLSTESETSFRQLASRAQAASLLHTTPTSETRYSPGMPSPSFDLSSPPLGVPGSRRRASTLVGRSISPTESKKLLVSSSTATGTISQRRKHSLASTHAGADVGASTVTVKSGRGLSPTARSKSPLSAAGDSTYKKSTDATLQEQQQRAIAREAIGNDISPSSADLPRSPDSAQPGSAGSRKRAMSQPSGHRRPAIPVEDMPQMDAAQMTKTGEGAGIDREPGRSRLPRKASMPLTPQMYGFSSVDDKMARTTNSGQGRSPIYSTHSSSQPYKKSPHASSVTRLSDGSLPPAISDMFPATLPSMQMGFAPSFASCAAPATMMWLNVMSVVPESTPHLLPAPAEAVLRPYHTMRQLCTSIECGAWLTPRLYVPREVWYMPAARVQAMDTKSRMLELLIAGIEAVASTGAYLQQNPDTQPPGLFAINTTRFVKQLEELDMLCMDVQNSLTRKLSFIDAASAVLPPSAVGSHAHAISVRKGGSGLGALSSKLTRGLDRMVAQSKSNSGAGSGIGSTEGMAAYADALARVCKRADQVLGEHTSMLLDAQQKFIRDQRGIHHDAYISGRGQSSDDPVNGYSKVSHEVRAAADARLRRASDFFSNVVLRFALRDVAILLDKSLKRSATALAE